MRIMAYVEYVGVSKQWLHCRKLKMDVRSGWITVGKEGFVKQASARNGSFGVDSREHIHMLD